MPAILCAAICIAMYKASQFCHTAARYNACSRSSTVPEWCEDGQINVRLSSTQVTLHITI